MNATNVLNLVLWSVQGFLALFFFAAGAPKVIGRGIERWTGFSDLPRPLVVFIGFTEVLGAAGLVLPMATGILPWLTPLAAVGLAIIVLMAAGFHTRADERLQALETGLWAGVAAVVAIGRWDLVASRADVPPWVLVAVLGLLVPSVIINIIVLLKRPVTRPDAFQKSSRLPIPIQALLEAASRSRAPTLHERLRNKGNRFARKQPRPPGPRRRTPRRGHRSIGGEGGAPRAGSGQEVRSRR